MKLGDLKPKFSQNDRGPVRLSFDCPACGPPYRISIPVDINGDTPFPEFKEVWRLDAPQLPEFSWDAVSVFPSINNTPGGHGRRSPCPWHGNIVMGEILP